MNASDFRPPPRRKFSRRSKFIANLALYGVGVPLVRILDAVGYWPRMIAATAKRMTPQSFGPYSPTEADVFVCAGFKSGTTWVLQIATQIAYLGAAEFSDIHEVVSWPDAPKLMQAHIIPLSDESPNRLAPTGKRVIKSHLALDRIPYVACARYIAIVRDPKDAIVSGFHFLKSMLYGPLMPSVEHWVDLFLSGDGGSASWAVHLAGFWSLRDRDNVLFLTYEGLQQDMPAAVSRIARFMRIDLTSEQLAAVIAASSWQAMKLAQHKFDPGQVVPWGGKNYFLRRGQSGNSSELLTPALQKRIDDECKAELRRLQCDFPYDEKFATPVPGPRSGARV